MTEWHVRYGGRGVMVHWHVERRATCIHSQLKRCSSSEVAAMIEGVLRHCTDMEIQRQYVDSHGQSVVGFAFAHLFNFELAPRLKAIASQKLMLASADQRANLSNPTPILAGVVDWDGIARQYDGMVKYAAAMQHGTAGPESILRRFSKGDVMHPTYKALAELGRAVKAIFLCRYLRLESYRREINEGLNVIENWNSANGFVFFGKGGEISTNRINEREIAALSLQPRPGIACLRKYAHGAVSPVRPGLGGTYGAGRHARAVTVVLQVHQSLRPLRIGLRAAPRIRQKSAGRIGVITDIPVMTLPMNR